MKKILQIITLSLLTIVANAAIPVDLDLTLVGTVAGNVGVRHAGDGSNRLFVISKGGTIRVFDDQDNLLPTPFLDIQSKIVGGSERGLLGLAFHPDYATNGFFYVNYTKASPNTGDTIIERYQVSTSDPNVADVSSGTVLLRIVQDFSNHNGGDILFGPDGYLYIPLGDGGDGNDPENRAQSMDQLLGKLLRIDVDGSLVASDNACGLEAANYGIPADNPFASDLPDAETCDEIWASGLRNPWRSSFDRLTGDFFSGDVGQVTREEINFQPATSTGGENYGWRCREGDVATPGIICTDPPAFVEPILVQPTGSNCSIMGGYRYRGPIIGIQGQYIYGDFCSGRIWFATESGGTWSDELWSQTLGTSSFGEDEQGNVYLSNLGGEFYRITGTTTIDDLIFANGFE
ncbi:MAG: PQQ-dependent sugar dehydrogenase [Proteobacteria bacterium]|nr:PQQ-dependent sugar dehydrogenase [Pseudomonadota bacterium]